MRIQAWHIIVLVVVIVLVFGSNRLPDMAKSVGQSMKVFKKEIKDLREDDEDKQSPAQIQQPQEGTYYTQPTQPGQSAAQSSEAQRRNDLHAPESDAVRMRHTRTIRPYFEFRIYAKERARDRDDEDDGVHPQLFRAVLKPVKEAPVPKLPKIKRSRRRDNPEARMSIGDHLRELRNRIFISALGVLVMSVVGYMIYEWAFALITRPIEAANAKGANLTPELRHDPGLLRHEAHGLASGSASCSPRLMDV